MYHIDQSELTRARNMQVIVHEVGLKEEDGKLSKLLKSGLISSIFKWCAPENFSPFYSSINCEQCKTIRQRKGCKNSIGTTYMTIDWICLLLLSRPSHSRLVESSSHSTSIDVCTVIRSLIFELQLDMLHCCYLLGNICRRTAKWHHTSNGFRLPLWNRSAIHTYSHT